MCKTKYDHVLFLCQSNVNTKNLKTQNEWDDYSVIYYVTWGQNLWLKNIPSITNDNIKEKSIKSLNKTIHKNYIIMLKSLP